MPKVVWAWIGDVESFKIPVCLGPRPEAPLLLAA